MENEFTRGHTYGSGCLSLFLLFCIFVFLTRPSPCNSFSLSLSLFHFSPPFSFVHLSFYPHVSSVHNNYGICANSEDHRSDVDHVEESLKNRNHDERMILLRYQLAG